VRMWRASMVTKAAVVLTALFCVLTGSAAVAAPRSGTVGPAQLALAIERRADQSSFANLERFGEEASRRADPEALGRIQHVTWTFLNQAEFDRFDYWNAVLARNAARQGDQRYVDMARINALDARYDRGDVSVRGEIARLARDEPDWFARIHAMSVEALVLIDEDQAGQALKLLSEAEDMIPAGDPAANAAETGIWETLGVALMVLDDLDGAAQAFHRADFEFADPRYPRPDYDDVFNMAHMATQFGNEILARELAGIHHRLSVRSDLPRLRVWDQELCAMVADAFGSPAEVMDCLKGLNGGLVGERVLAQDILPLRGIARARLGDIAGAKADLDAVRALRATQDVATSNLEREPQLEAELLMAQGRQAEAFKVLSAYVQSHSAGTARRFNVGVHQLTGALQTQLATARTDAELQRQAARTQKWIVALGAVFLACAGGVLVWQRRSAGNLRAAQLKAEMASRSKSEFLANMSHEIRTPLNGVVGVAELLAASDLPKREREMVEIIRNSGQSLERLLSDVLDLARVEAGRMTIEPLPFHAGDLVRSVAGLSRLKADEKGLSLRARISPQLEGWFIGDATRVRQILTNLVSNAVKFTDSGSVTIIAEALEGKVLRFEVADTGVGFDAPAKARLFGRFQQADGSITRRFGGSGLGLAISRQLASLMGGELDCESEPGRGSRFWFEAPFEPCAPPAAAEEAVQSLAQAEAGPVRVLVVDDHETNRTVVRMMLEPFGVETVAAANGAEAVERVRGEAFDAVLMDMQMPVMDGLEATRTIRAEEAASGRRRTPVIMLTANALPEHCQASLAAGADGHVSKPVTATELLAALNAALDDAEAAAAAESKALADA
jgi:signal transduction histidine kinase/AmiR/NasT family two-component response regulator